MTSKFLDDVNKQMLPIHNALIQIGNLQRQSNIFAQNKLNYVLIQFWNFSAQVPRWTITQCTEHQYSVARSGASWVQKMDTEILRKH